MRTFRTLTIFAVLVGLLAAGLSYIQAAYGVAAAVGTYLALNALCMPKPTHVLRNVTTLADLWVPPIWINGIRERVLQRPTLLNTGAVTRDPQFVELATGPGKEGVINYTREPNFDDEVQEEGVEPTINGIGAGDQKTPILNRVSTMGTTAIAQAVSGANPVGTILDSASGLRDRQRNRTLLNILRGCFGFSTAPADATAALYQLRYDAFSETGANPGATQLLDTTKLIQAVHLLGEEVITLAAKGGAIAMHSTIAAALHIQDQITEVRNSEGALIMYSWKGLPVFVSDLLVRNGGVSGKVYDTYILGPGSIGTGDKPQSSAVGDVAHLMLDLTQIAKNNVALYDRTRFVLHVHGTSWKGTPVKQSASNAELATAGNWELAYSDARFAGVICIRTNG